MPTKQQSEKKNNNADAAMAGSSPGERLRYARAQKNMSPEQVAEKLHLSKQQIIALESDDYSYAPALAYARGHLRLYAALVGISSHEILKAFDALGVSEKISQSSLPLSLQRDRIIAEPRNPFIIRWWVYGLGLIVLILLFTGWRIYHRYEISMDKSPASFMTETPMTPAEEPMPAINKSGVIPLSIPGSNSIISNPQRP